MSNALKFRKYDDEFYFERTQRNQFFLGGKQGQEKIRNLKIGIAGLGGMGSNIAEYLARLGVGHISLADPDTIDISNINRQVIANTNTVGMSKAVASQNELSLIAPEMDIDVFETGITEETIDQFIKNCDFVVDEIDVFPLEAHYLLHKKCREKNIPVYSAYVIGLGVHFYKFHGSDFTFEDFIHINENETSKDRFNNIVKSFITKPPKYLTGKNLEDFKDMANNQGVPIFGPSCLIGHSVVVTRILCDFLDTKILGEKVSKTPIMPKYIKIDFTTLNMSIENLQEK